MNPFLAELLGTMILVLLGNGVVCNVLLTKTKGNHGGWIVITFGWGIAVFVGACIANEASGAHLNPALTIAMCALQKITVDVALGYVVAQFLGAMLGAALVYLHYRLHFQVTESADDKLGCFCNAPNIAGNSQAFLCEVIGTFVLVFVILQFQAPEVEGANGATASPIGLGSIGLVQVGLLVIGIGLSLGGTTGYAINPARDLGPRIMHFLLPIRGKRDSNWSYAWIPVAGPIGGALLAALVHQVSTQ
jgi:glycerol uptake facilitator protein